MYVLNNFNRNLNDVYIEQFNLNNYKTKIIIKIIIINNNNDINHVNSLECNVYKQWTK